MGTGFLGFKISVFSVLENTFKGILIKVVFTGHAQNRCKLLLACCCY